MTAPGRSPLVPLLETLEDPSASHGEQTDAYLTLTSRMTGEDGKEIIIEIEKKLPQLFRVLKVSSIIDSLEIVFNRGEVHSAVVDYEALNVVIRLIEQAPIQMGEESIRWAKLVIPLVVHSAQKVHLRGATALEMGMPLLLQKQQEIASITEQLMTTVCVPLIQSTISIDSNASPQGSSSRVATSPALNPATPVHKGASPYGAPRMNLSSSFSGMATIPSIQVLGLEMLLHFLLGPEVLSFAKQNKLTLSLERLEHPLITSSSFFSKHANTFITAVHDSFFAIRKDASDAVVNAIWKELVSLVKSVIESGNKKERPGSEVLTLLLKSLESIVKSEVFPVLKTLVLMEITIKGLPQKVLGSPAYQVANMDILNASILNVMILN
ncbi:hypothetical protein J1605_008377 [Eschrichtius robustus]|uniref:Telomere-associated protein Rif1 N-terminal domain-containing protein n=1 Tax=Eschrichtius robustus TaxID=9764 RepID=A0AB34GUS8_ESCRO|nr:hypothetical protein J1605_008377 [Eschrichtius robustus]